MPRHGIIIGAMKNASTSVFYQIAQLPQISASNPKDTKFFLSNKDGGQYQQGYIRYLSFFSRKVGVCMEASTHYSKYPDYTGAPERILKLLGPETRLVYLIRNPIERTFSHIFHNIVVDEEPVDIDTVLQDFSSKYFLYSDYNYQLSHYSVFPRENIYISNFVDSRNKQGEVEKIYKHITGNNCNYFSSGIMKKNCTVHNALKKMNNKSPSSFVISIRNRLGQEKDKIQVAFEFGLTRETFCNAVHVLQKRYDVFSEMYPEWTQNWVSKYERYL